MSDMSRKLEFISPHSFVDSSFFQKLSDLKLNDYRLDTSSKTVYGSYDFKTIGREQGPIITLNDLSFASFDEFSEASPENSNFITQGFLFNLNTIEDFKKINKNDFLKKQGARLYETIVDRSILEKLNQLTSFTILAFSDLKKYKFYYWFNFPLLHSDWLLENLEDKVTRFDSAVKEWITSGKNEQFFLIDETNNDNENIVIKSLSQIINNDDNEIFIGMVDTCCVGKNVSWGLQNCLTMLNIYGYTKVKVLVYRVTSSSFILDLVSSPENILKSEMPKVTGWERTSQGKLGPKLADLGSLINPVQLADQAVDLNLKLMKWRVIPEINLSVLKETKCLLLGAGTLGSYVARALLGWGFRNITFIDNGKVSFSNPVRQPLFQFKDCLNGGVSKAIRAAEAIKEIYPSVNSKGYDLEVPMAGHPITNEAKQERDYQLLIKLIEEHDVIFLLMDSRETRWLPTVVANVKDKIVMNAALGFDSYLVMRHGCVSSKEFDASAETETETEKENRLGCYFCNDVVAPSDSLTDRTLDQMCTVTRPGAALIASALTVELLVSILQHPLRQHAPASSDKSTDSDTILGSLPHQIRGFLHNFNNIKLSAPSYQYCSACSLAVLSEYKEKGWEFVKEALNDSKYLENLTGLTEVQKKAEEAAMNFDLGITDEEDAEWL
ncbi:hypothetical protein PACTADRAFT_99 [Pachysolen tannophilus NRRL Y-2460]|uniref:Ubiquitin-like modifier-activating enzyme ATG7 n=1 Tax=Pachysolen tannophilus NRRL Y-2460 TaxID=669874 RepID=A0A1E4U0Q6_PACTA|nr:hypothetical protein PACTADRAFT_99 [Pachysolen tannophilus NRRL Y-2460]